MKKKVTLAICLCLMTLSVKAQYQYDRTLPLPRVDLYDTGAMNMYLNALAQTAPRREAHAQRKRPYCALWGVIPLQNYKKTREMQKENSLFFSFPSAEGLETCFAWLAQEVRRSQNYEKRRKPPKLPPVLLSLKRNLEIAKQM